MVIDFELCKKANCDKLQERHVLKFEGKKMVLGPYCQIILEFNGEHYYCDNDGNEFLDEDLMLPWDELPEDCPFAVEQLVASDHTSDKRVQ